LARILSARTRAARLQAAGHRGYIGTPLNLSISQYQTFQLASHQGGNWSTSQGPHSTCVLLRNVLLGLSADSLWENRQTLGQLLETFVYQGLRRQASWHEEGLRFHHYRDKEGTEVDIVLEGGGRVAGVEVKAGATVTTADFRGLRRLREASGEQFASGVVLYDGEARVGFGDQLHAVPLRALWEAE
jgi:hypothetical protein